MSKTTPKKVSHTCTQGGPARCLEHLGASGSDPETRGRPWEPLGDFRTCGSFQEPLGSSGSLWELLGASGSDQCTGDVIRENTLGNVHYLFVPETVCCLCSNLSNTVLRKTPCMSGCWTYLLCSREVQYN